MDKGNILSSTSWRSIFRKKLGVDVHPFDIHKIFQKFGLQSYVLKKRKNGTQINGYYEADVKNLLQRGEGLKKALQAQGVPYTHEMPSKKRYKGNYVQYAKPKLTPYKPMNIVDPEVLPQNKPEYKSQLNIEPTYRNNENDMEKHSDYLIQQYQFENTKPKVIIITEEQFKKVFQEKKEQ